MANRRATSGTRSPRIAARRGGRPLGGRHPRWAAEGRTTFPTKTENDSVNTGERALETHQAAPQPSEDSRMITSLSRASPSNRASRAASTKALTVIPLAAQWAVTGGARDRG